ncbi:hypothetical protein BJY01DRAFT_214174 [Aspergillus pseudoustus]|uniref:Clr5 domain-containing protein n=1 Tax=Aspergillus pseudoustus TaxID=1810923 RepID=A0ABR4JZN4_9EURO
MPVTIQRITDLNGMDYESQLEFARTMGRRRVWRDCFHTLWLNIETKVYRKKPAKAQRFRRALHEKFGLSKEEWEALRSYFANYEAVGVVKQRNDWLEKECSRLRGLLDTTSNSRSDVRATGDADEEALAAHRAMSNALYQNRNECRRRVELLWKACCYIEHTPIARALKQCRGKAAWHMHPWLRQQCVQAGGCCARRCQCCSRRPGSRWDTWVGHCTPACTCCMKHDGVEVPIAPMEDPIQLRYSIPPAADDLFGERMMDFTVWRC